jgi:hypothetical protein
MSSHRRPIRHRLRGEILLKRDPAGAEPAEEAFRTAVAIAKQQGARSFELLASLSLAKFYLSTRRIAEAHAILAPALEGFSPSRSARKLAAAEESAVPLQSRKACTGALSNAPWRKSTRRRRSSIGTPISCSLG